MASIAFTQAQNIISQNNQLNSGIGQLNTAGASSQTGVAEALSNLNSNFWVQLENLVKQYPQFIFNNPQMAHLVQKLYTPEVQGYIRQAKCKALMTIIQAKQAEQQALQAQQKDNVNATPNHAQVSSNQNLYGSSQAASAGKAASSGPDIGAAIKGVALGALKKEGQKILTGATKENGGINLAKAASGAGNLIKKGVDLIKGLFS